MSVSPARAAAFDALLRVERDAAFAADALDARLARRGGQARVAKRADAALATQLVMGVLRWRRTLDFLIERFAARAASSLDLEVLLSLRLGLYQLRYLSRVPVAAAVHESVELAKRARKSSAAGLVNAALRRAVREPALRGPLDALLPAGLPAAERLGVLLSHPTWLVERWLAYYGEPATRALLESNNRAARLVGAALDTPEEGSVIASLTEDGFEVVPAQWLAGAFELCKVPRGGVARARALSDGRMLIQDEASQVIPLLLGVHGGDHVLDLCAAPGGKTVRLARQARQGIVVAADVHPHRLRQMREFLGRLDAHNARAVAVDGTMSLPFAALFARILVDAPCSGTGTLARNPEIRWRLQPEDLAALAEKQKALLSNALHSLAPQGRLVYSTCSLEPEENEQVVAAVLAAHPEARIVRPETALAPHLRPGAQSRQFFDARGFFHTLPWQHGTDGFFAAAIEVLSR